MQLLHGDCLELMKNIPDGSVDMVLCDPPYGTTACKWDSVIPFVPMWEQLNRIIKDNGAIVLFGSEPFSSYLICSNVKMFKQRLIWKKHKSSNFACAKIMHLKYTEDIIIFGKNKINYYPQMIPRKSDRIKQVQKGNSKCWNTSDKKSGGYCFGTQYEARSWDIYDAEKKYPEDILEFPAVVSNSKEKVNHPTQKPVALLEYLIKSYTLENETVLDFTMGSGSTGVACKLTNRNFIGIEKDDKYFEIAKQRIENGFVQEEININENSPLFE